MNKIIVTLISCACTSYVLASDLKVKNRIYLDADLIGPYYQKDSNDTTSNDTAIEIGSLKSSIKYDITDQLKAKIQIEYKKEDEDDYKDDLNIKDVYLAYQSDNHTFTLGRLKEPMGHEETMSSADLPAIERSLVSTAFAPGRNIGLLYELDQSNYTLQLGQFMIEDNEIENGTATSARAVYHSNLSSLADSPFHLGFAFSKRSFDESLIQFKERGEVNTADNIIRSARFRANEQNILQAEAGFIAANIWFMGEYYQTSLNQINDTEWQYQGFYIQAVGGFNWKNPERHLSYKYKNTEFKQPKMKKHDIEWVIRYSGIDLQDYDTGAQAASFLLGVNYYFNKNTSVMLDALFPSISGNVVNTNHDGQAISLRLRHFW